MWTLPILIDGLLEYVLYLVLQLGADFENEALALMQSLLFDAKRRTTVCQPPHILPRDLLAENLYKLDIIGTIRPTLFFFREDMEKVHYLHQLGVAVRIKYNLKDLFVEAKKGLINISIEDMEHFHLSKEDLSNPSSPGWQEYFESEARSGLRMIEMHRKSLKEAEFAPFTLAALNVVHERPAKKFLQGIAMP